MALLAALAERLPGSAAADGARASAWARARATRPVGPTSPASCSATEAGPTRRTRPVAALLLEANVDDLDPRLWPEVLQRLLPAGADDAWLVPILMKKGRPGAHRSSVLCPPDRADGLRAEMLALTSTVGVRQTDVPASTPCRGPGSTSRLERPRGGGQGRPPRRSDRPGQPRVRLGRRRAAATLGRTQHDVLTAAVAAADRRRAGGRGARCPSAAGAQ